MYYRKALGLVLFLLSASFVFSQEAEEVVVDVNHQTYQLYLDKNWEKLVEVGDSAIKSGNDFYYLRLRLAVAYFELKKFRTAELHFKKALEFNSFEDFPKSYLYYCLLYNQKYEESRILAKNFTSELKHQIGFDSLKTVDVIGVEYGRKITSYTLPNAGFLQLSLNHTVANKFSLFHVFSRYGQSNRQFRNIQFQYYLGANIPLKNNFKMSLGFHYMYNNYLEKNERFTGNNFIGALNLKKSVKNFDFSLGSTGILLDSVYQFQHEAGINYYPFSSSLLNIGLNVIAHTSDNYKTTYLGFLPIITLKPSAKFSVFTSYLWNQGNNISEWNGFLVNNSIDVSQQRINLGINYAIGKKWEVNATYQHEIKIEAANQDQYTYNSIFFGIKYKP